MAKVTIIIEPEEENEGTFGHTAFFEKENVVTTEDVLDLFSYAARGGGWYIGTLYDLGDV